MASGDIVAQTNAGMMSYLTNLDFMNIVGWIVFALVIIGACVVAYIYWRNRKIFNKKTTDFEIVGVNFEPTIRDSAKTVKLGSGGFEILYLKKLKQWRLAYGGRVGKFTYYFFRMPDGYPYNAMLSANLFKIDELGGLIPVVTTNASMRSQYTSLEKQIDTLHAQKPKFWDKYGGYIMSLLFVLISGVLLWLMFREFTQVTGNLNTAVDKISQLIDKMNIMLGDVKGVEGAGGLVPIK